MKKITLLLTLIFSSGIMYGQILFEDDFDGSGPGIVGWTVVDNDGLTPNTAVDEFVDAWIQVDRDASGTGGPNYGGPAGNFAVASTSWYTPAGTSDDWLITPQINLTVDASVTWDAKAQDATYADGYELLLSTSGTNIATDFTEVLFTIANENENFQTRTIDLSAYTGQNVYLAWRNNSSDQFVLLVDNVIVEANPSCFEPSDFTANTIEATSFDVSWTDTNGPGTTFDIEWGAENFVLGSGTTVTGITTTNYVFSSLTPDTTYEFYITANCTGGNGASAQVGPIAFLTAFDCATYSLPIDEPFDNANAFASCYTTEDVDGNTISWIQQALDISGDATLETFATNGANGANAKDDWLISPAISVTAGNDYDFDFDFNAVNNTNPTPSNPANENLEVLVLDAPNSGANVLATIFTQNGITQSGPDFLLNAYNGNGTYTPMNDGDVYLAFRVTSPANSGFLLLFNFTVNETLSVSEFESNTFTHSYNKATKELKMNSSNLPLENIEIYNILGQNVNTKGLSKVSETVNIASLNDGVYIAKVSIGGNSKTFKFVKN